MDRAESPVDVSDEPVVRNRSPLGFGLWNEVVPGSLYRGEDNEYGYWHIKTIEHTEVCGHEAIFVMLRSSHGDHVQGVAPPTDHAVLVACCDALKVAHELEYPADYDFDGLADLIADA